MKERSVSRPTAARGRALAAAARVVVLAMLAAAAHAEVFPDLYTVTVTPDPESGDARAAATDLAMRRLLTRITGVRDPGADPGLASLIADAPSYVSFIGNVVGDRVQVEFYSTQVERALASMNRPYWGPERPLTLLWIAIDGGDGGRVLLSANGIGVDGIADTAGVLGVSPETEMLADAVRDEIEAVADERGLPILFPQLDLEDMASITSADIWGGFVPQIQAASERYGADAILIGRIRVNPFGNTAQWTLARGDVRSSFAGTEVAEGLQWVADTFVQAYSVVGGAHNVRLVVRDVSTFNDYARVLSYLEGLSALQSVDPDAWDSGLLTLRASARGDIDVLEQVFGLGRVLRLDGEPSSFGDNTLVLRLVRGSTP